VTKPFAFELLDRSHKRDAFSCGVDPLDRYFYQQVTQDVRRCVTACYLAVEAGSGTIAGYYTLAAGAVLLSGMPPALAKKLPRYPDVPVARLGRLAVDRNFRGRKLGAAMLWDAVLRAKRSEVTVYGLVVDAKDDNAIAFYKHHGFASLTVGDRQLILPLAGIDLKH
jgi:ribosomal protein S18 acetylase RimI-like enzyme